MKGIKYILTVKCTVVIALILLYDASEIGRSISYYFVVQSRQLIDQI
jgi:hypothetical protein